MIKLADLSKALDDNMDKTSLQLGYSDEFWEEVEKNVDAMHQGFNDHARDLTMSHQTLHKPFTI